jgi:hypothetical protein
MVCKNQNKVDVLNITDKVKILDLLKSVLSLVEVGYPYMNQAPTIFKIKNMK